MNIEIDLKPNETSPETITFPIELINLEEAVKDCYIGLGTPYEPIAIDNFVIIGRYAFPAIEEATKISISLQTDSIDGKGILTDPELVCCTVKNVGKGFVDKDCSLNDYWKKIFKYKKKWVQNAPDGTLYISPNKKGKCVISTKKSDNKDYISYSIMFSMMMKNMGETVRRYYFILDPLVKISSGGGTNQPKEL